MNRSRAAILAILSLGMMSAPAMAWEKYDILMGGYYNGASLAGALGINDVFEKVPVGFEIGLGYSWTSAGDAILARKVWINQDTNGDNDAQSSGGVLDFNMNFTYPLPTMVGPVKFLVYAGPRIAHYDVRFEYVGGNEDFDVVSWVYGLGGGLRASMPLGKKVDAIAQLGVDYYPRSGIYGHDATYYPDNSNINARTDGNGYTYTYQDAVNATTVPHIRPRIMVGVQF